ncbi:MAG TPA: cobalamin-dependent protein [Syntrophorhabdaceae bacterium]|nr:cobalamin-dependent protein [Syntrophorhabdaceae bacterium]
MKVLLVQPPIEDFYDTAVRTYPLALLYIASKIRNICDVSILDCRTGVKPREMENLDFPELASFYRDDRKTPFSLFGRYSRYGMGREEIAEAIRFEGPDLLGISSSFTAYSREALDIASIAKGVDADIATVVGGTHPTVFPGNVLKDKNVDYVIRGEGETPFFELVRALSNEGTRGLSSIPGLSFRRGDVFHIGDVHTGDDIDIIPARDLAPVESYRIGKRPYTFFLTSRGCPFQCAFCGKPPAPYRRRSLNAIEKEISDVTDLGIKAIDLEDDMLNLDIPFFHSILDILKGGGFTLSAMNGLYSQTLDVKTLEKMYEAGFSRLNFSLVDTSPAVHVSQHRAYPANLLHLFDWLEEAPFLVETHFIIGLPGQTPGEIIDTMVHLMGRRMLPGPSIYYLAPGSPLFGDICGEDPGSDLFPVTRSSVMLPVNPLFPRETTFTFMKLLRFVNVVKGLIDANPGAKLLEDLADAGKMGKNPRDRHIFTTLIREKRFVWFDVRGNEYVEEPQDRRLAAAFFKAMEGKRIKGFRTNHSIEVNETGNGL